MRGRSGATFDALGRGAAVLLLAFHALTGSAAQPTRPFPIAPVIEGLQ
jgi:hypothetical protein